MKEQKKTPKKELNKIETRHLLHIATLSSLGSVVALPNTHKQTQGGCQNEKTKKHGPNERRDQN